MTEHVEPTLISPTFVVDYPIETTPLAKRRQERPDEVERFEAYIGGMEIGNAFTELNDPVDQRRRFVAQVREHAAEDDEAQAVDDDFLEAVDHGMPPTGGLGVGIDRLVMILSGQTSIREVILFPQLRSRSER
jgi:lysyl-tRNA synthetase class 2